MAMPVLEGPQRCGWEGMVRTARFGWLTPVLVLVPFLVFASLATAQEPSRAGNPGDPSVAARQAAEQAFRTWNNLAQNLEGRLARLLPCDAQIRAAIRQVS